MNARIVPLGLAAALWAGAAFAHHGWGSYEVSKIFKISAPVEMLEWANPHAHLMLKHEGATWEATLAPLSRMEARGSHRRHAETRNARGGGRLSLHPQRARDARRAHHGRGQDRRIALTDGELSAS